MIFEYEPDVPEEAKRGIEWLISRGVKAGLGHIRSLVTRRPGFQREHRIDPKTRITYLFEYEEQDDETLVKVSVESRTEES